MLHKTLTMGGSLWGSSENLAAISLQLMASYHTEPSQNNLNVQVNHSSLGKIDQNRCICRLHIIYRIPNILYMYMYTTYSIFYISYIYI